LVETGGGCGAGGVSGDVKHKRRRRGGKRREEKTETGPNSDMESLKRYRGKKRNLKKTISCREREDKGGESI